MTKRLLFKVGVPTLLLLTLAVAAFAMVATRTQAASTWPNYKNGSSGENVVSLQYMLRARGYSLAADGQFGPITTQQVKSFQSKNGLTADGIVGPLTWEKLVVTTKSGSKGDAVIALQRQLNAHGASLTVDGDFGSLTNSAVRSFQSKHSLSVDGIAGVDTWHSLITNASTPPPPPTGSALAKVVAYAKAIENGAAEPGWKGGSVPYSWAGGHGSKPGPSLGSCDGYTGSIHPCPANKTVGVDCSGFARWVYSLAFGSDVLGAGSTRDEIKKLVRVSASAAQPGDLVYYGSSASTVHHVGVYIGGGKMIDALKTGTFIRTDSVNVSSDLLGYYHLNR